MKANEAPEKIYLTKNLLGELFDGWDALPSDDFISIEYTRTDTFIEKAVDYIANNMRCDGYTLQTKMKFIKRFQNYMEGE